MFENSNFTPKDKARELYAAFLKKYKVGPGSKILTLLGRKAKEIPYYDNLGVKREDIWVVERDSQAYLSILRLKLGTKLYAGELSEFVRFASQLNPPIAFDVINADFCGSMWDYEQDLRGLLPFLSNGLGKVLAITSLSRRDNLYLNAGKVGKAELVSLLGRKTFSGICEHLKEEYRLAGFREAASHLERELGFIWWLALSLEMLAIRSRKRVRVNHILRHIYQSSAQSTFHVYLVHLTTRATGKINLKQNAFSIVSLFLKNMLVSFTGRGGEGGDDLA